MMNCGTQSMQHFAEGNIDFAIKERCIVENYFYHIVHEMQHNIMSTHSAYVDFTLLSDQRILHLAFKYVRQN